MGLLENTSCNAKYMYRRVQTFEHFFREGDLRVIRPFVYVREKDLRSFAEKVKLINLVISFVLKAFVHSYDDSGGHSGHRNTLTYFQSVFPEQDPDKLTQRDVLWSVDKNCKESFTSAGSH